MYRIGIISLGLCSELMSQVNGSHCRIKDLTHVLDYRHLNPNLFGDLLCQDTTVPGVVINAVTGCREKARISTQIQSVYSVEDTGCTQLVETSPGGEIVTETCLRLVQETRKVILQTSGMLHLPCHVHLRTFQGRFECCLSVALAEAKLQWALDHQEWCHPAGEALLPSLTVIVNMYSKFWGVQAKIIAGDFMISHDHLS